MTTAQEAQGALNRIVRRKFQDRMRHVYGPQWWKLYLKIAREFKKSERVPLAHGTYYYAHGRRSSYD